MNYDQIQEAIKWAEGRGILYVCPNPEVDVKRQYVLRKLDEVDTYLDDEDAIRAVIGESHGQGKEAEMARALLVAVALQMSPEPPLATPFEEGDQYWRLQQTQPNCWSLIESVWDEESMHILDAATEAGKGEDYLGSLYPTAYAALDTLAPQSFIRIEPLDLNRVINLIKS